MSSRGASSSSSSRGDWVRCDQTALRVRTIDVVKLVELVQGIGLRRNTCEKAGEHAGGEHTARAAAHAVHSAYDARRGRQQQLQRRELSIYR
eukprot:COSAG06_NODE_799_length_12202_cov_3.033959_3_plen_92_part_00